ncbi:MAG: IPT/TIG domain-containing protein, partial [Patescibacteria group bacterium]
MEEIINKLSQAVKTATPKRNWGVPIAILSAFALIGVGMYYGYFETLFHGAKAASTFTFDFDNENDYNISPNVTVRGGYAMNDLVYTAAESGLNDIPSFTDILAAGPLGDNIIALVSQPNQILHSSDAGANWATIAHPSNPSIIWQKMINGVLLQPNKRIYFFGHTADSNSIGRFTYAQCELANQAACIDPFTQPEPQWSWTVSALGVPNLVSFGDAYTNNINIWAGASVVDPVNPATTNGWVYSADKNLSSGSVTSVELLGTTAVNDIMAAGQYQTIDRYAAVTSRLSGRTGIWYTENNDGIWKEATLDPTDSFSHLSVYSLTKDGAGYIYATTDRSYILKSTIPNGTEFKRTANTDVIGAPMEGAYYAIVHDDNLLVFDKSGRVYRAVDYNSATGFTKLIESNTPFATGGTNFEVADSDYPLLFGNYLYLAVNNLSNNTSAFLRSVYAGYQFPANPFNRTVVNTVGINYTSLSSFDAVVPLSSNGNPRFRLKNYAAGQWRYYDTVNNVWSVSSSQGDGGSNTAQEINAHIGTFAQEFGQGKLFIETILSPKDSELGLVPYILDSVTVNYEANYFNIESVVPNSGPVAGGNTVNINGTDLNEQTRVKFGSHYSPNVNFIDSTHLTAVVPASTLPGDKTGWVDVSILDENTDFTYQKTLSGTNGYHYTAYTVGSIEISDVPEYTALNQAFNLTVTVYDSNHQVLSNFDNETIRIMIDNNDDGIPDTDDGGLLSPSIIQPVDLGPTGWVNGSQTGQFTISVANLPQPPGPTPGFSQHTIVATYSPTISDSATTITVDVEDDTIPVDHFDVTVPLFGVKNTNFPIRVEAKTIQDLVKTNFVPATGNPVRIYADGNADGIDDGVIQPTTIGVINESGEWLNGVASFDAYQISVADTYTIEANYILSPVDIISGTATINISGSSQQLPPQISSVDPTEGPITGGTAVIISGSNFGTAAGPTTDPTIVRFGGVDATNVVVHSTEMITA